MKKLNGQLVYWLLAALIAGNAALAVFNNNRMDRIEDKVDQIQAQYGRIAVVETKVISIEGRLTSIESLLYQLIRSGTP